MAAWHRVAKIQDLQEGQGVLCTLEGRGIALFKSGGQFFAMDNQCPHRGASLSEGEVKEGVLTCPWHAWQFEVKNGCLLENPEVKLQCFPVKVEGEDIYILGSGEGFALRRIWKII